MRCSARSGERVEDYGVFVRGEMRYPTDQLDGLRGREDVLTRLFIEEVGEVLLRIPRAADILPRPDGLRNNAFSDLGKETLDAGSDITLAPPDALISV